MEGKDPLKKDGKMTLRDADGKKQIYVKGLTGNAKAFATYDIAGMGVTMLKAEIGVDAVMNNIGQTVFTVEADGKPVYTSKEMNGGAHRGRDPEGHGAPDDLCGGRQEPVARDLGKRDPRG